MQWKLWLRSDITEKLIYGMLNNSNNKKAYWVLGGEGAYLHIVERVNKKS